MCDCEDVKKLTVLLNMERLKTKIYRQIIEQKLDLTLNDKTDDLISEAVVRKCSPASRKSVKGETGSFKIDPVRSDTVKYDAVKSDTVRSDAVKSDSGKQPHEKRRFKPLPKSIEETEREHINIDSEINESVVEKFGNFDISVSKLEIKKAFESLKESKTYTGLLINIKNHRTFLMTVMNLSEYSNLIFDHLLQFKNIFSERSFPDKKINALLSKFLTPLDFRLTFSDGFEKHHVDVEEIEKLKLSMKLSMNYPKAYRCFEHSHFYNFIINYSLAFLDLKTILNIYITNPYDYKNIIYVPSDYTSDSIGFSFFILDKMDGVKRCWKMDCRLEHIVDELICGIKQYVIATFRKIYRICIGHNDYIEDYKTKSEILEFDCQQLLENMVCCVDNIKFNNIVRTAVKTTSTHIATTNDKFDFIQDDKEQLFNFGQYVFDDIEKIRIVKELFDGIDDNKAVDFFHSIKSF